VSRTRILAETRQKARSLRKAMTKGEVLLWLEMRALKADGLHFRRQAPVGPYVVDFVCLAAGLIVEVDGDLHETEAGRRHDASRDAYLRSLGYRVMRVDAPEVPANAWHVAPEVKAEAGRPHPTRSLRGHPPLEGEGSRRGCRQPHPGGENA